MKPKATLRSLLIVASSALLATPAALHAQTAWDGGAGGGSTDYSNNLNWVGDIIPGNSNANGALIGNGNSQTVVYNTATSYTSTGTGKANSLLVGTGTNGVGSLTLSGSAGTLTFGGDAYNNAAWIGSMVGAGNATGLVTVTAGKLAITGGTDASINLGVLQGGTDTGTKSGTLIINGGTVEVGRRILMGANSTTATGVLTISSGTLDMKRTGLSNEGDLGMVRLGAGTNTVNLNGGTVIFSGFHTSGAASARSSIFMNGTTLRANAAITDLFNGTTSNTKLEVKNDGLIVDTNNFAVGINDSLSNFTGHTGFLRKQGANVLTLSAANSYTGQTFIDVGTISIQNNTALGTTAGNTVVASGATAYGIGTLTALAEAFNITGTGVGGFGALRFGGGTHTINVQGAVTLGGNASISADGGITLNMSGGIDTAGHTLTLAPTGTEFNINTVGISGAGSVIKSTTATVTFNAANSHSVATTINQGTLTVGASGTLSGASASLAVNNTNTGAGNNVVVNLSTGADTTVGSLSGTIATPTSGANTATINTQTSRTFTVNQTSGGTYAGVIAGAGGFTLGSSSSNTLTLTGANTYTGGTKVSGGTLVVNNTIANSATTVETTGVITGTGVLGSSLTVKSTGVVNAGTVGSINTSALVTGATNFESGSIFSWDLSADGATGDKLTTGSVTGSGATFRILLANGTANDSFFNIDRPDFFADTNIISSASDLTALFSSVEVYSALTNTAANISSRGSFSLTSNGVSWTAVPEPTSALAGLLLGAGLLRRRRSSSSAQVPQRP